MRLNSEKPANEIEEKIESILVESGYDRDRIEFHGMWGNPNSRYLRVGYWGRIDDETQKRLGALILSEDDDWDDDCGYKFSYRIR